LAQDACLSQASPGAVLVLTVALPAVLTVAQLSGYFMAFRMAMSAMFFFTICRVAHLRRVKIEKHARIGAHIDSKEFLLEGKIDKAAQVGVPVLALDSPAALAQEDASQVSSPVHTPDTDATPDSEVGSQADSGSEVDSDDSGSDSDADSDGLLLEGAEEDPEGLCLAVQELLEPFRGIWFIKRNGSAPHEDDDNDDEVEPRLFCFKVAPHDTVKELIEETHVIDNGDGDEEDNHKPNFNYFNSSFSEEDLLKWFDCVEVVFDSEDDDSDDDIQSVPSEFKLPTCEERKEIGRKLHSLFAEHGKDQFSYKLGYEEGLMPTVTTDGIGVVTASGFAVGIEASLVLLVEGEGESEGEGEEVE